MGTGGFTVWPGTLVWLNPSQTWKWKSPTVLSLENNLDLKRFFFLLLIVGSDKSQCSYTESRNIQYPSLQQTLASITFSIFVLLEFRRPMVQSEWTWSCKSQTRSRWVNDELFHAMEFWQQFVHSELFLFPVIVITNDFIVNCPSEVICL